VALPNADIAAAVLRTEVAGFALRGHFDPSFEGEQVCARRLLARVHAYTQKRLRREIEPVTVQDFMRFLLRHHGVEPEHQRAGTRGVLEAIEQLQGYEVAAALWESDILGARVAGYRREWLDGLCLSGQVSWGRVSCPSAQPVEGRTFAPTRATPITLAMRSDLPWLIAAARGSEAPLSFGAKAELVIGQLREAGALFYSQLVARTRSSEGAVRDALWEGVARGLVSADGFDALRSLLAPSLAGQVAFPLVRRSVLRQGARAMPQGEGRWSLLTAACEAAEIDRDALCEAVAEQWLARWGVLFRELALCETTALPWREVLYALRRLEARGVIRGGRFVTGFSGEQYATPEAVAQLRSVRRETRRGIRVELSGADPLNLTGVLFSGPRVPSLRTHTVSYVDGVPEIAPASVSPRLSG
jgi:ATP-dependent Lhr-like helicase